MGSPEGYFRIGLILAEGPKHLRDRRMANAYFAWASLLGHQQAIKYYDKSLESTPVDKCGGSTSRSRMQSFRMNKYLSSQPMSKQKIAAFIRRTAPQYGINARVALGIALAESNLNPRAVSPNNAQGVMQLTPDTQRRFGVTNPFDAELNVRGGLAYLRWLKNQFHGNWTLMAATYNSGEATVMRYGGIPPFTETKLFVKRVHYFARAS